MLSCLFLDWLGKKWCNQDGHRERILTPFQSLLLLWKVSQRLLWCHYHLTLRWFSTDLLRWPRQGKFSFRCGRFLFLRAILSLILMIRDICPLLWIKSGHRSVTSFLQQSSCQENNIFLLNLLWILIKRQQPFSQFLVSRSCWLQYREGSRLSFFLL